MANWEAWFDEVMADVPGCPLNVAKNAIRNAAIEFCERTYVYVVDHPAISAVANTGAYPLAPGAGLKVIRPDRVWYQGVALDPITTGDLSDLYPNWSAATGTPKYFVQERLDELLIVPKPTAAATDAITAKVAVAPSRASTSIPDALWERYLDAIASGAKARIMAIPKKPYSSMEGMALHQQSFDAEVDRANLKAFRGHTRARNNRNLGRKRFL